MFDALRAAATLHHALIFGYITTEALFLRLVPAPVLVEWIKIQLHDRREDIALALFLHTIDQLVEDPGTRDELRHISYVPVQECCRSVHIPSG